MTKNNKKESIEDLSLEEISPGFEERQAVIDACASDKEFMKEQILNGNFSETITGYFNEFENAKEKYREFTGREFPQEKESGYISSYLEVSEKLNKFYRGDK